MTASNQAATAPSSTLELFVRQIRYEGRNIQSYELVDPDGRELPPFTAGAHIDVHLSNGIVRQYSLCNSPGDRRRYVIAVLRDEKGRGGSKAVHEQLHVQDRLRVSYPRNNFELAEGARKIILLAGGIGVTPLKSMAHQLAAAGDVEYEFHYCAREAQCAAFMEELKALIEPQRLHFHFDGGEPSRGLDIGALLRDEAQDGTHVYYCGPAGFMRACAEACGNWPTAAVHCEHFKAPERASAPESRTPGEFTVEIASTGQRLPVPVDKSIADVLKAAGIAVQTSCEAGLCATCKVRYLAGEVEHQDCILDGDDQRNFLTICVSRGKSELLVLDL
ncbi:vanillate O-demethylase ferredoxin subunit [Trinickia symbiotica]|uniref:Oxidoreductase n=1 Tax=Trinickia symbiotica TaxID=863227 RepID=A0A2N7X705_9BURK|nr:PDR/VanB family oxidoreductase [Trinickia symbiotica]PMS37387.1 oxidoreductase [Trinickia symbiotica]PPK42800.1 vanillate O-demethylase ferredoxin subunit [Trinickia symbiotica]